MFGTIRIVSLIGITMAICALFANVQAQPAVNDQANAILDQIKKTAKLKFSPTTVQNSIDAAAYELKKISTLSLAAAIDETAANAILAEQIKADNRFSEPKFSFNQQTVDGTIEFSGPLSIPGAGQLGINAELHAQLATSVEIVTTGQTAEFKISFAVTALDTRKLRIVTGGGTSLAFVNSAAQAIINGVLVPAQTLLNHIVLHVPTVVTSSVELKAKQQRAITVSFDPPVIKPKLEITAVSHLVSDHRLTIAAQEGAAANPANKPNNIDFSIFRADFENLLVSGGARWVSEGQLSAYVDRHLLQRLASKILNGAPMCMEARIVDLPAPFATKLALPGVNAIDCTPKMDCTPTKDCRQTMACEQNADCRACILRAPRACAFGGCIGGNCIQMGNDPTCEARKVANKGACELEKVRRNKQCEVDKAVNKASCEYAKAAEKQACEELKAAYKLVRATGDDYANVSSQNLVLSGDAKICIKNLKFNPDTLNLTGTLSSYARAKANGSIKLTPLNVVGHVACFAPIEKNINTVAEVPAQDIAIDTSVNLEDASSKAGAEVIIANPIHIRFPFKAIALNLATDPQFTVLCPIPGAVMRLRLVTPDKWWPRALRGEVDHDLPDFRFDLDLVRRPEDVDKLQMAGIFRSNKKGIGAVFTVKRTSKTASSRRLQ